MTKVKFQQEYIIRTSPAILYNCISTPSGLSEWFADDVNVKKDKFIFIWDGQEEWATILSKKNNEFIRFKWDEDEDENSYVEIRIKKDSLTKDTIILVTDFSDEDELEENKSLWDSQITQLKTRLGA